MSFPSEDPAIPPRPIKAPNGIFEMDFTSVVLGTPFMRGYVAGIIDGARYRPFKEGLVEWSPDLEPPFIPMLDESFRAGYREGFRDGRLSKD